MADEDEDEIKDLRGVITALKVLTGRVNYLVILNEKITKWLIIAICTIAVGKSALDLGNKALEEKSNPTAILK